MDLKKDKEYVGKDGKVWTFLCWIPDQDNPGKRKAAFARIVKKERFISEGDLDTELEREDNALSIM